MGRRVPSSFLAVLLVTSISACGQAGASPSPAATGPTATPSEAPSATRTISLAENGQSIALAIGDRFVLMLGEDFDWSVAPVDESVIVRLPDQATMPGIQGQYRAVGRGTTTLSATGDPPCRKATPPCAAPSILFHVTLEAR